MGKLAPSAVGDSDLAEKASESVGGGGGFSSPRDAPYFVARFVAQDLLDTQGFASGVSVNRWESLHNTLAIANGDSTEQPVVNGSAVNGRAEVSFDGTDILQSAPWYVHSIGEVFAVVRLDDLTYGPIFATLDESDAADRWQTFLRGTDGTWAVHLGDDASAFDGVSGGNPATATWYVLTWRTDGTAWAISVNGTDLALTAHAGSNTGEWAADVVGPANVNVGGEMRSGSFQDGLAGDIADLVVYGNALSPTDRDNVTSFLQNEYAIA